LEHIVYRLNYYQIIKRKREFLHNELKEIQNVKRKYQDTDVLLGISILLGNQGDIQYYYEELLDKVKEEFLNYPIMNLIEDKSFINNK
jgi:histidinol phosphatase-like PHP family hydrolase